MSRSGDHDGDSPLDPFDEEEEEDPFQPQRPLRDPLRPDLDPFRIPADPFQFDDPFQRPSDPYDRPADPYGPLPDRTDAFEPPDQAHPPAPSQGLPWDPPPPPQRRPDPGRPESHGPEPWRAEPPQPPPATPQPEPPAGGYAAPGQQGRAPIPSRAARHQQKRRSPWPFSRGSGTPGPADPGTSEGALPGAPTGPIPSASSAGPSAPSGRAPSDRRPRPPRPEPQPGDRGGSGRPRDAGDARRPGDTTGQFGRIPGSGVPRPGSGAPRPGGGPSRPGGGPPRPGGGPARPGGVTGPFDAVPGGRSPGGTTGQFEPVRAKRLGSTGEFPPPSSNGRANPRATPAAQHEAPSRAERGTRRSRGPNQSRQLPSLPKFEVPSGLARTTLGLVAILVIATAGLGAVTNALPRAKPPATPATAAPYSARWICPLLPNQATSIGVANVGGAAATLRTTVVSGPGGAQPAQKPLDPGGTRTISVPAAKQPGYVQVEAFSSPIAVGAGGRASCASGPTDRWWIPAADSSLGASTAVVVANPDNDPAVVDLVPHVGQGALVAAAELFVPPRSAVVKSFSNGELITLKPAIEVIAKSGRVVAGAVIDQQDQQKIFVPGQPTTRSEWSFAGGLAGPDRSTSVLITNPSASPLSVSVQVSTDRGTFKPGNDFDNPIPGGSSAAILVPPLRIGGSGAFALRISSRDGAKFVAALRVSTPTAAGDVTYLDLGTGGSDRSWFVPAVPASKQVVLANLGKGPVSARLRGPGAGKGGGAVRVDPGKVIVRPVPSGAKNFEVTADRPGLLVAPLGGGLTLAGADIGGVPAGGPVVQGQAAA